MKWKSIRIYPPQQNKEYLVYTAKSEVKLATFKKDRQGYPEWVLGPDDFFICDVVAWTEDFTKPELKGRMKVTIMDLREELKNCGCICDDVIDEKVVVTDPQKVQEMKKDLEVPAGLKTRFKGDILNKVFEDTKKYKLQDLDVKIIEIKEKSENDL